MFKRSYGKKEGTSIARSTPRRSEVSLKDSFSLGAGRSWKRENKKKEEREKEKTSRPRVNQLHFWLFFLRLRTLAPLHLQTHSLSPCFLFFPSPPLVSFVPSLREGDEIKFSIDSSVSLLSLFPITYSFLSLSLFLTLSLKCNSSFDRLHRNPFPFFPFILLLRPSFFTKRSKISSHARLITAIFSFPCKTEPCGRRFEEIYVYDGTINFVSSTCHCTVES